jgi:hypothetical protein
MAIIQYIHTQLSAWARWRLWNMRESVGFPPTSPMFRDCQFGGAYGSQIPVGVCICDSENMQDMDAAIARLGESDKRLCVEFYMVGGGSVAIAARLGVSKKRLYENLECVQARLLGLVNDVVAERL